MPGPEPDPAASLVRKLADFGERLPADERLLWFALVTNAAGVDTAGDHASDADVTGFTLAGIALGPATSSSTELELRMQQFMDQRAKATEVAANIIKNMNETSSSIIANMK